MVMLVVSVLLLFGAALILLCIVTFRSSTTTSVLHGSLYVNGDAFIATIDEDFICATLDWWPPTKCDYGTCSWGNSSLLNLDLSNPFLLNAVKAFAPLKLRLGGTLQDKLRYQTPNDQTPCTPFVQNSTTMFGFDEGCLPISRWDELSNFFKSTGAKVVFGLNALTGRMVGPDGSSTGAWDSTNAKSLIRHTIDSGYTTYGWELGNEVSGSGIGAHVAADQYASDLIHLQQIVQKIYNGIKEKPIVIGPGGFFELGWFKEFTSKASSSLQVVTHHIYNLGPGVDDHLVEKILNPSYLDGGSQPFRDLQNILKNNGNSTVAWVGEAGGAYNSGRDHITNSFVFSFWYLDQLGMSSTYDTKTYCRQTLIGGNYGLLNTTTFAPNPDYYSALLWHRLMGSKVLSTSFIGTNKLRAYAHCSKNSTGMTLLLMNLDNSKSIEVDVSIGNGVSNQNLTLQHHAPNLMREEYHLSAKNGDIQSQTVLLNSEELSVGGDNSHTMPQLKPKLLRNSSPLRVSPLSILFARIPSLILPACR